MSEGAPPDTGGQQADAHGRSLGDAEALVEAEQAEVEGEQDAAAEVAHGPALGADPVAFVLVGDPDEDRVVDDERRAEAHARDEDEHDAELPVGPGDEEHRAGGDGAGPREAREEPGARLRSAMAPTKMRTIAETIVETVTV